MRAWVFGSSVALLAGCTPIPDETKSAPEPPPQVAAEPLVEAEAVNLFAWRWVQHENDGEFPQVRDIQTPDNLRYQFIVDEESGRARVVKTGSKGREEWSFDLPREPLPAGFMRLEGNRLFVAVHSHIASGARVIALDAETGKPHWKANVHGLGPVNHSKYRNRVQLDVRHGMLLVYGHESQGRYVEAFDLHSGEMRGNERIDDAVADIAWAFSMPEGAWPQHDDGEATVRMEQDGVTYEIRYPVISSGGTLTATGADWTWTVPLDALGRIAHSEYFNAVEMRLEPFGVVVFGREAQGNYVEVRDRQTGQLLSNTRFLGPR